MRWFAVVVSIGAGTVYLPFQSLYSAFFPEGFPLPRGFGKYCRGRPSILSYWLFYKYRWIGAQAFLHVTVKNARKLNRKSSIP